jgi:DNA-binding transcriptional LysR family regulator
VAKHEGISEAVRNMPYGIQQPAVSSQLIQLENSLGTNLFQRRPFALTPAGIELYAFIRPFFDKLEEMAEQLRGGVSQHLRIGSGAVVLRDHLPLVLQEARTKFPRLTLALREGYQRDIEQWLLAQEVDLGITVLENKPLQGIKMMRLLDLPMILLVRKDSPFRTAKELWQQDKIKETLISLPPYELVPKLFQQAMTRRGVDWFTGIEVSSMELVQTYVAKGYGIGVSVVLPQAKYPPEIRWLPLEDFPAIPVGALWLGKPSPIVQTVLDLAQAAAKRLQH